MFATTSHQNNDHINATDIQIPLAWLTGSAVMLLTLFFSITWWIRGLKSTIDQQAETIKEIDMFSKMQPDICAAHEAQMEKNTATQISSVSAGLKKDIAQSASDICHGFELFAVEIRQRLTNIEEKMVYRDEKIEDIKKKYHSLGKELFSVVRQLQNQDINIHRREEDTDYTQL